jgi:hypothetical protein
MLIFGFQYRKASPEEQQRFIMSPNFLRTPENIAAFCDFRYTVLPIVQQGGAEKGAPAVLCKEVKPLGRTHGAFQLRPVY